MLPDTPVKLSHSFCSQLSKYILPFVTVGTVASVAVVSEAFSLTASVVSNHDWYV